MILVLVVSAVLFHVLVHHTEETVAIALLFFILHYLFIITQKL